MKVAALCKGGLKQWWWSSLTPYGVTRPQPKWVNSLRPNDAYIYVSKNTIIGKDNGLSPGRRQAIIWTNAGMLLIEHLGTKFNQILIKIYTFSLKKIHLKISSVKWNPFCLSLNVLMGDDHSCIQYNHASLETGAVNYASFSNSMDVTTVITSIEEWLCSNEKCNFDIWLLINAWSSVKLTSFHCLWLARTWSYPVKILMVGCACV